ncbi:MAG: 30S ribosomal protein S9 [Patescibacteria group bacterium]
MENTTPKKQRGRRAFIYSRGKRKTASARIRYYKKGNEEITVNDMPFEKYFTEKNYRQIILSPIKLTGQKDFEITARILSGGKKAQAEAMKLAIARAIVTIDETQRKVLKKGKFLTRDSRRKERKKPGLKRARRAPQWSKR